MARHIARIGLQQHLEVLTRFKRAHEKDEIVEDPEALQRDANDLDVALGSIDLPGCLIDHTDTFFRYGKVVNDVPFGLLRNCDNAIGIERGVQSSLETVQPISFG